MSCVNVSEEQKDEFIKTRLSKSKGDKIAIVLVGGPGSGKSIGKTETLKHLNKNIEDFANIDVDEIITQLYANNISCYNEAYKINDKSFSLAMERELNIIYDRTGKDYDVYMRDVINPLINNGYTVHLVIVSNDVNTVKNRIRNRASETGRNVNLSYTEKVYDELNTAIPKYLDLDCNHINGNIFLYDNSSDKIVLVYSTYCKGKDKRIKCVFNSCVTKGGKRSKTKRRNNSSKKTIKRKVNNK